MKIRSITYFFNPGQPLCDDAFEEAQAFIRIARPAFEAAGFEVQTARLATVPFGEYAGDLAIGAFLPELAMRMERMAQEAGFEYISLGPARPDEAGAYAQVVDTLKATQNVFLSGLLTSGTEISLAAVRACARVIHEAAAITPDGFANLRFAALGNVPPGAPFFPAAYHRGQEPAFGLAIESADLAVAVFSQAGSLEQAQDNLVAEIERYTGMLESTGAELSRQFGIEFTGVDFTLAPYPEVLRSVGAAIEGLGVPEVGLHGTLAACAILTSNLDRARFKRVGFNGLMLPVLEDAVLGERVCGGQITLNDLLLYSAVCGTGLDTVPLPGDSTTDELGAVLLDLAALAVRLNKPLTARLMPIPGKAAGEPTSFDFDYFTNSRVMPVRARPLEGLLGKVGSVRLVSR
jgi:uncharacterized protein (UPF0210 family)